LVDAIYYKRNEALFPQLTKKDGKILYIFNIFIILEAKVAKVISNKAAKARIRKEEA